MDTNPSPLPAHLAAAHAEWEQQQTQATRAAVRALALALPLLRPYESGGKLLPNMLEWKLPGYGRGLFSVHADTVTLTAYGVDLDVCGDLITATHGGEYFERLSNDYDDPLDASQLCLATTTTYRQDGDELIVNDDATADLQLDDLPLHDALRAASGLEAAIARARARECGSCRRQHWQHHQDPLPPEVCTDFEFTDRPTPDTPVEVSEEENGAAGEYALLRAALTDAELGAALRAGVVLHRANGDRYHQLSVRQRAALDHAAQAVTAP